MASFGSVGEFVIYEQIYNSSNFATLFSPVAVLKQGCYLGMDRERKHLFPLLLEIPLKIWFSCVSSPPLVSLFLFQLLIHGSEMHYPRICMHHSNYKKQACCNCT